MEYVLKFLQVMVCLFLADICWALYFMKVTERKALQAGVWAIFIYLFGAISIYSFVQDKSLIIAALIGSFLGTYATVEYKRRKESKKSDENSLNL